MASRNGQILKSKDLLSFLLPGAGGGGLWSIWWRCLLGSEGPGDELGAAKSPKEALACEGFFQTAFHCEVCVCVLYNNSYTC